MLDVDAVAEAALSEVAVTGLARLTVAAVARRLQVTPRAIYHYVPDRDGLARIAVARWLRRMPTLSPTDPPREALRRYVVESARHFVTYRFIHDVALAKGFEYGEDFFVMQEREVATLVSWGASPSDALLIFNEIARFVDGSARHYPEVFLPDAEPIWPDMGRPLSEIAPTEAETRYPLSATAHPITSAHQIAFGLDLFLDGLTTRLPALRR